MKPLIKKFYKNHLTSEVLDRKPFVDGELYYNNTLRTKIDSLIYYYPENQLAPKYYKEFWLRRSTENNDSTVFIVLTEIQQILKGNSVGGRQQYIDPTFGQMIQIMLDWQNKVDEQTALRHFDFLKKNNLHQSAFNLLYENFVYDNLELDREQLRTTLTSEYNVDKDRSVFIIDNTK